MFGFGKLASYDYFAHLRRAFEEEFARRQLELETYVAEVPPTASIRRRSVRIAELVARTSEGDAGPIHLLGHSTGGLDVRLLASPSSTLPVPSGTLAWVSRVQSVVTLNTPHYGTPLAGFFATVSGQRMLYAISALTVVALSIGTPPMAIASALVVAIGKIDRSLGMELSVLDRATDSLLRLLDPTKGIEVRRYLDAIKGDQAAVIQLTPEAMDLFQSGVEDRKGIRYLSAASMAPGPTPLLLMKSMMKPWAALSSTLFSTLYGITSRIDALYPCAPEKLADEIQRVLIQRFGRVPHPRANDGVVPFHSQLWGEVVWVGKGDHLDVLGHFRDEERSDPPHVDWMTSGSGFNRNDFRALVSAMVKGMLNEPRLTQPPLSNFDVSDVGD